MRKSGWSIATGLLMLAPSVQAFPPYRSTDADTAPVGALEARLGLVRVQREADENRYAAPLLRLNLGIAPRAELVLESEYDLDESRLGDGALGIKLVSRGEAFRWGVETLALLPVNSTHSGAGIESQIVATWKRAPLRLHLNAGGIYDARPDDSERGWRASVLAEFEHSSGRFGVEVFAREFRHERTEVQLGAGWIVPAGPVEFRIGLHTGLTGNAPELTASLWISTQRTLWQSAPR
jgi:hypothetical protein